MTTATKLHELLLTLRRQRRRRLLLEAAASIIVAVVVAVLAGMLVTRLLGADATGVVIARLVGYALVIAAAVRFLILPLMRRASDAQFALYVEEHEPALKQALLSAVHELDQTAGSNASPALTARVVERAVADIRPLTWDGRIERPRTVRAGRVLALAAVAGALLLAFGPSGLRDAAKVLFAPWSVAIAATPPAPAVNVEPGNAEVPRGGSLDIRAALAHFSADGAELVFRSDSAAEWIRIPMGRDSAAGAFTSRLFDLTDPTQYYVEANGVRSQTYRLRVSDLPAVQKVAIELRFPSYTGLDAEREEDGGDVAAVIGTTVIVEPAVTRPVREGTLTFDDGTTVPLAVDSAGRLSGRFRVKQDGFYRVDLVAADGRAVTGGVQYVVEALPDRAPDVRITTPGRDTKVTSLEEVTIEANASDDYGVRSLELRYRVNGGAEQTVTLAGAGARTRQETQAAHTLMLEEIELKPGDLIAYNAAATDATGQESLSDVYFLEIRPWTRNYRQADAGGGGGGGGGGESPTDFVRQQRDVVAGTYNWLRDSASRSAKERAEDVTTLAIAQGRLRQEVERLSEQLRVRGLTNTDTIFAKIQQELASAATEMKSAEEELGQSRGRRALPAEERALAHVQRADALYRDVQIQQQGGGGGGGGGGGQQNAEDLADLFELETDRMRNQYEAVQQQGAAAQAQEVDETLERLRELAARQQQENERMQRQAQAMRERLGREASGGGGGSQRELARRAEEEARRLERLAREQDSQELARAAQQMQQAADAMRRAASGSESEGNAALEQLERATRGLEESRNRELSSEVRALAERAAGVEERQQEIAQDVSRLQGLSGAERAQETARLTERKEALSGEVDRLEADADRLSREGRRDQPGAASELREATESIRESRIRDRIQFSKSVIRGGSPEYATAFEGQISSAIEEAAESIRAAASALEGESAARRQERALESARELVRGVESLRERTEAGQNGQGEGQQGEGQQGQQGEGQQGEGQQGQGQQGRQGEGQQGQGQQGQQGQQGEGQQGQGQQGQGQGQGEAQGQQGQGQGRGEAQGREGQQAGGQGGANSSEGRGGGGDARGGRVGGRMSADAIRQFSREFGLRRENAEALRDLARAQGVDVAELDRAIRDLRRLESGRPFGDPQGAAELQDDVIDRLKTFEFGLYRLLTPGDSARSALSARSPVPSEYRAQVEEYYRSLARPEAPRRP